MLNLRPYQQRIIQNALKDLTEESRKGSRRVGLYAPCGSGKSLLAAFMAQTSATKGNRVLVLTHRVEILKQNFSKMDILGSSVGLIHSGSSNIPNTQIICAMAQTLKSRCETSNRKDTYYDLMKSFDFIIIDEAHRGEMDFIFKYIRPDAWVIGMTATWLRSGSQNQLGDYYSRISIAVMPSELVALGNILPSDNYIFDAPKLQDVAVDYSSGDYNQKQLQAKFKKKERYAGIIDNYQKICLGKKFIVFTTGGDHCVELTQEFCNSGIKTKYLLSEKKPETDKLYSGNRADVLDELRRGDIDGIVSVEMLSTGLDLPELECVILDFSTKSYTKYQQCVARPDRPFHGQEFFYVLDFGDNVKNYGKFEADPVTSLWHKVGGSGVAPSKFCPEDKPDHTGKMGCGRIIPVSCMNCPYCGYQWQTEGEIYNVTLTRLVDEIEDIKNETIEQFCARMKLKGWKNTWILQNICKKNKENPKKAFMRAITVLRGENGEMISPGYWWIFKKMYLKKETH